MSRKTDGWVKKYQEKDALWIHDGNVERPHALLTSGMHSNGFFNSRLVTSDEPLLREAASDLVEIYRHAKGFTKGPGLIVGPQTGATKLAEFISDEYERYRPCGWVSPEKVGEGKNREMLFSPEEFSVLEGEDVLLCEDVITTGGSIDLTAKAVTKARATILPFVLALVNRSGLKELSGRKILALIDRPMQTWTEEECPLCKLKSKPFRPKDNWYLLNKEI